MKQENGLEPIVAKDYKLKNIKNYGFDMNKSEFISLLNILQSYGETLDSMHDVIANGYTKFCDITRFSGWNSMQELSDTLSEFAVFFTEKEFIDWIIERVGDLKEDGFEDPVEEIRRWTYQDDISDTRIYKTEDGYVMQVSY